MIQFLSEDQLGLG